MDKHKAAEMIERQRRRWRSQDSDLAIARRAERIYFALAIVYACLGTAAGLVQHTWFARAAILTGFLSGAIILCWQSRRFGLIRKSLVISDAKSGKH